jgi:hypothetical protein
MLLLLRNYKQYKEAKEQVRNALTIDAFGRFWVPLTNEDSLLSKIWYLASRKLLTTEDGLYKLEDKTAVLLVKSNP